MGLVVFFPMKRGVSISQYLRPLSELPYQVYLTNELQVADVLEWILAQVGVSEVWQTSFSISEEFLRRLFFIEKGGLVKRFNLILDLKATQKTLRLWPFICQTMQNVFLADNHSKVLLVKAEGGAVVTVLTSQNLTRGNRIESAMVTTDHAIFDRLFSEAQCVITNKSVPLHGLFERKIAGGD